MTRGATGASHPRLDDLLELRHQAHSLGIASHHLVNSAFAGVYASVFRGQGLNFEEVREYREGDDIRNMDWKVTARTNKPHLKVYREERERSVVLCVDHGPHMFFGTRNCFKSVQAARAAALLGWAANSRHDRVGGLLFGDAEAGLQHFPPTKDRRALWRLLSELANPSRRAQQGVDCLQLTLQRAERGTGTGALIFVIADFNRAIAGLDKALGQLCQKHAVVVIPVDDPADRELPAMGHVLFRDAQGELIEIDTDDAVGRAAYASGWQQRREALRQLCNRLNMTLIPISTEEDVHLSLMQGLRRRARVRMRQ
ncbi:DUF58 domain-containing protein [Magnetovirga frankeli]|uniref:DUF58 domain-containing protein n=1 Tax=Magnetovirga frankeli TaxID=947516 RepID=UPI0012939721|nr:DUF58 domain-containing protein [gamma proteobacterium SS-5]